MSKNNLKKIFCLIIAVWFAFLLLVGIPLILLKNRPPATTPTPESPPLIIKKEYQELSINNSVSKSATFDFAAEKIPRFRIRTDMPLNKFKSRIRIYNFWNSRQANLGFEVTDEGKDKVITLEKGVNFNPGTYVLKIVDFSAGQNLEQQFSWGVMALNQNKSSYLPGEAAEIYLTVLNDAGETECQAEINLKITTPSNQEFNLSTQNGSVIKSNECQPKNFTYQPDFKIIFTDTKDEGRYQLVFEAKTKNGVRQIEDFLEVKSDPDFVISRQSATRIFPPSVYEMKIKILPQTDFTGEILEAVPASFNVFGQQAKIEVNDNYKILNWSVKLIKNQEYTLSYNFNAPDISPEFYFLGPLRFYPSNGVNRLEILFEEPRAWQLAADAIPSNIIIAWLSPTPPAGWSRDTTLDGYFLKGTAAVTDPGGTGGFTTHNHGSTHSHTHATHTHVGTVNDTSTSGGSEVTASLGDGSVCPHNHPAADTHVYNSTIATELNATVALSADANNSMPPYYDVLWIKSDGTTAIPANGVVYYNSTTPPSGFSLLDGSPAPNLNNTYLRGAATAASPGGTGGATSHSHTTSNHSHTQVAHGHSGRTSWINNMNVGDADATGNRIANVSHTHLFIAANNQNTAVQQANAFTINATTWEPPYSNLAPVINASGDSAQPSNIIAMWRGTLANIPAGWLLCDGTAGTPDLRGQFAKGSTSAVGCASPPCGSVSHSHTANAHSHLMNAHSHVGSTGLDGPSALEVGGTAYYHQLESHTHTHTSAATTDTVSSVTVTVGNNTNTQPPFYTVAYIQFQGNAPANCYVVESLINDNLTVNWSYSETNEDSFDIYRSVDGGGYASLGTAVADATSYLDSTTTSGHTYAYQVRAVYGTSASVWCTTPTYDTLKGSVQLENLRLENIKINLRRLFKVFLAFVRKIFRFAYAGNP